MAERCICNILRNSNRLFQRFQHFRKLIRTRSATLSTCNSFKTTDSLIYRHTLDKGSDAFGISFTSASIYHLHDDIVLDFNFNFLGAYLRTRSCHNVTDTFSYFITYNLEIIDRNLGLLLCLNCCLLLRKC